MAMRNRATRTTTACSNWDPTSSEPGRIWRTRMVGRFALTIRRILMADLLVSVIVMGACLDSTDGLTGGSDASAGGSGGSETTGGKDATVDQGLGAADSSVTAGEDGTAGTNSADAFADSGAGGAFVDSGSGAFADSGSGGAFAESGSGGAFVDSGSGAFADSGSGGAFADSDSGGTDGETDSEAGVTEDGCPDDVADGAAPDADVPEEAAHFDSDAGLVWVSGGSGLAIGNGTFASWRGSPLSIAGTWNADSRAHVETQPTLSGEFQSWEHDIDIGLGAYQSGSWSQAALGADDATWTTAIQAIAQARAGKNGTVYLRLAEEMNCSWYVWGVTPADSTNFKTAWVRFYQIARQNLPTAKVVFGPFKDTCAGNASVLDLWPGDDYVDVLGVDGWDMWPNYVSQNVWDAYYMLTNPDGSPRGLGTWLAFAKQHGKPMAVPEWGLNWTGGDSPGPEDDPFYIQKMNEFFRANAGTGPGQLLYEIYFNGSTFGLNSQLYPVNTNPNASAQYQRLVWGQ
jgi:hypothetical protein